VGSAAADLPVRTGLECAIGGGGSELGEAQSEGRNPRPEKVLARLSDFCCGRLRLAEWSLVHPGTGVRCGFRHRHGPLTSRATLTGM